LIKKTNDNLMTQVRILQNSKFSLLSQKIRMKVEVQKNYFSWKHENKLFNYYYRTCN